jgi:hypothetical protein
MNLLDERIDQYQGVGWTHEAGRRFIRHSGRPKEPLSLYLSHYFRIARCPSENHYRADPKQHRQSAQTSSNH